MPDTLLPDCVLPGCRTPVATVGDPCQGCIDAFGPMLVHNPGGQRMTAEEIADRDRAVHWEYERRAMLQGRRIR